MELLECEWQTLALFNELSRNMPKDSNPLTGNPLSEELLMKLCEHGTLCSMALKKGKRRVYPTARAALCALTIDELCNFYEQYQSILAKKEECLDEPIF